MIKLLRASSPLEDFLAEIKAQKKLLSHKTTGKASLHPMIRSALQLTC